MTAVRPHSRQNKWLLALVLVVAAIPRTIALDEPGLTYDEYYDFEDSRRFCEEHKALVPISDGYLNGQAPFVLACIVYRLGGEHEIAARGVAVAAGLLTVWATYFLARRVLRTPFALLAAMLLGLSPFFVSASRLAFSHGHVFAVPWLVLALRVVLGRSSRLDTVAAACTAGLLAGFAAGNDLLAGPWILTLAGIGVSRLRRRPRARKLRFVACFAAAWLGGLGLGSPMYIVSPIDAVVDIAQRISWWDSQLGHVWLGAEVQSIPAYYYVVVLVVKLSLPVLLLIVLALCTNWTVAVRMCVICLWPVVMLSFKGWKSPFYLMPFLPLLYVVASESIRRLALRRPIAKRTPTALTIVTVVVVIQVGTLLDSHPHHLMTGIRYGQQFYGEFAGPAVSHGQWAREALKCVHDDAWQSNPVVLVPLGYAPRQVELYAARLGLAQVHTPDRLRRGVNPRSVDYIITSHDMLANSEGVRLNGALLRLVADGTQFCALATVHAAGFPIARIWKRYRPEAGNPGPAAPREQRCTSL